MNHLEKVLAIKHIRPESVFILRENDVEWLSDDTQPTEDEIEAGWVAYQEAQTKAEADKAAAKAAAEAKLAALGLTVDDLKALGLG